MSYTVNSSYEKNDMGRKKVWDEGMVARFPIGTLERIDAVLEDDEYRTDFIWSAVQKELKRRERHS